MLFVDRVYLTKNDIEMFIKGLVLIEIADGELSQTETAFIYNRAKILNYPIEAIDKYLANYVADNLRDLLKTIKFSTQYQAAYFLSQAIRLGYQDGCYSGKEIEAMRIIAKQNGIEKFTLSMLEALAKLEDSLITERKKILDSYL